MQLTRPADLPAAFAAAMARLGPFGPAPILAVGVSGGADSTALALLAQDWAVARGGTMRALIVDHGLRPAAAAEAALTAERLAQRGILCRILTLSGLPRTALQEFARAARHAVLAAAARQQGAMFLLLGHHAADQAETVAMRAARGPHGLEAMAGWVARPDVLLVRPLLGLRPAALRDFLRARGMQWVDDPSNTDQRFERVRVRQNAKGLPTADPACRLAAEQETAEFLARHVTLRPNGFAVIHADTAPTPALGALLRVIGANAYAPNRDATAALGAKLRPATLGGAILARTGKFGGGWLLAREPAACAPAIPARAGPRWDNRFSLAANAEGAMFGALGGDASRFRGDVPAIVLRGLPCLRQGGQILFPVAAPFRPPAPLAGHPFVA